MRTFYDLFIIETKYIFLAKTCTNAGKSQRYYLNIHIFCLYENSLFDYTADIMLAFLYRNA